MKYNGEDGISQRKQGNVTKKGIRLVNLGISTVEIYVSQAIGYRSSSPAIVCATAKSLADRIGWRANSANVRNLRMHTKFSFHNKIW